jgi:acetyltransferase-like isoleucine patch superfamily enzyme
VSESAWIHPTALVEPGVTLGEGTKVWDGAHVRRGARVGRSCIVGEKSYIAYGVTIGDFVKLNAKVYICAGVTIEDFCMLSAHTVFTNDRFPRAGNRDLTNLETSAPTEDTLETRVRRGATIGANATIGPGLTIGEFAMVGMGSVVTRDVPDFALAYGNPARSVGWVCVCGQPLGMLGDPGTAKRPGRCERCGRAYSLTAAGPRIVP